MARVRFRARFWVILIFLVALLAFGIYMLFFGSQEGELKMGAMRLSHDANTVLIRDEASIVTEKYDKIIFDVVEGAPVEDGTQIAQVFRWGYQDSTMQSLLDVRKQILAYQLSKIEGIVNAELDTANAQINQKLAAIRGAASNPGETDLLTLEQELKSLLTQRMELLRNIQSDETLDALYRQEEEQLNNLATWKRDIVNSAGAGIVSFYFDGYETALNAQKLDVLNADLIASVLQGSASSGGYSSTSENRPLYRLVDSNHFYIAFLTSAASPLRLAEGETYLVAFEGYEAQSFTATALAPIVGEKNVVNILEFQQDMGELMGIRTVKASVMMDASGYEVPLDAITVVDGMPGIELLIGDTADWVAVDVLAADDTHAIIRAREDSTATLAPGQRFKRH